MRGMDSRTLLLRLDDGRDLEVVIDGPPDGPVLVFHSGTPSGAVLAPAAVRAAAERGCRTVLRSRPGYGSLDGPAGPRRRRRRLGHRRVLDELGAAGFVTLGWSGGGAHALACAALRPGRCRATALIGGVAPYGADGIDWSAGMGPENLEEFAAAAAGPGELEAFLGPLREPLSAITGEEILEGLGELLDDVDRSAAAGELAGWLAANMRRAVSAGTDGWRDDDLAFVKDWDVDLSAISRPRSPSGRESTTGWCPIHTAAGWPSTSPGPCSVLEPTEGHLSLFHRADEILDDLLATRPPPGAASGRGSARAPRGWRGGTGAAAPGSSRRLRFGRLSFMIVRSIWPYCRYSGPVV